MYINRYKTNYALKNSPKHLKTQKNTQTQLPSETSKSLHILIINELDSYQAVRSNPAKFKAVPQPKALQFLRAPIPNLPSPAHIRSINLRQAAPTSNPPQGVENFSIKYIRVFNPHRRPDFIRPSDNLQQTEKNFPVFFVATSNKTVN